MMLNRITFYFSQASANLKRSILIIISISIAISMVAGALYYTNSYEEKELNDAFTAMPDISVSMTNDQINFTSNLNNNFLAISQSIEKSGLDIANSFKYGFLDSDSCYIYQNYINNSDVNSNSSNNFKNMSLNVFLAGNNFYESSAFSNHFTVLEGKLPTNESEILMDDAAANYFNYHVGENVNLTVYYGSSTEIINNYTISNVIISGIYSPKFIDYSILGQMYMEPPNNGSNFNSSLNLPFFTSPIFSYKNYSYPIDNNPFQQFSNTIFNENKYSDQSNLMAKIGYKTGVGIQIDKNIIKFSNMNSTNYQIENQMNILSRSIPENYIPINYISIEITNLIENTFNPIFTLLIFIIPFLIFAFIIGSFSISNISSRFDEFFLLESKGTPKKMIRNQMLLETLLIGIISSIFASLLGIATFSIYKKLLGSIIFINENQTVPSFPLYINWESIGITFLVSIGVSLFTGIAGIIAMNKVEIPELLNSMGEEGVTAEYDESTLFGMNKPSNLPENEKYDNITRKNDLKSIEKQEKKQVKLNNNKDTSEIASIKTNLKYYKDHIKRTQKKIPKVSYVFIVISLFPLLFYFLGNWGMQPNAPDFAFFFHRFLTYSSGSFLVAIFFIISPIFMAVGIIRFLTKESPSRYAKISRFLSKPFLKAKSYLIGFEMIKRKKLRKIIYIIGIFTSLLVLSNFIFSSESRYPIIINNLSIGSDVKLTTNVQSTMYNTSFNQILDNNLRNITTAKGTPLVTNALTYYEVDEESGQGVYYFNFTKYLQIIQEGGKFVPKGIIENISKVIAYDNNASNIYPGAIVDQNLLTFYNYEVGDLIYVNHTQYDSQLNKTIYTPITVKIVASYEFLPGISVNGYTDLPNFQGQFGNELAIDSKVFEQSSQIVKVNDVNQLVDLNLRAESNDTIITGLIENSTSQNPIHYSTFSYYDQQWNSPLITGTANTTGFYGLIYFEFMILGIILSIGLASLLNSFQRENKYFFGLLMSRGFGKRGIFSFMVSQLIIIFLLALISGIISGVIPSLIFIKLLVDIITPVWGNLGMPIFFNSISLLEILGLIIGISFTVYIGTYYIQMRKSISQYMRKF